MAPPILLVHDDIATTSTVRRLLSREGHDVVLATSTADAAAAFSQYLPSLLILAPAVEEGRGRVVLDELAQNPGATDVRLLLLGDELEGYPAPTVSLPVNGSKFVQVVREVLASGGGQWLAQASQPAFGSFTSADAPSDAPGGEGTTGMDALDALEEDIRREAAERRRAREARKAREQAEAELQALQATAAPAAPEPYAATESDASRALSQLEQETAPGWDAPSEAAADEQHRAEAAEQARAEAQLAAEAELQRARIDAESPAEVEAANPAPSAPRGLRPRRREQPALYDPEEPTQPATEQLSSADELARLAEEASVREERMVRAKQKAEHELAERTRTAEEAARRVTAFSSASPGMVGSESQRAPRDLEAESQNAAAAVAAARAQLERLEAQSARERGDRDRLLRELEEARRAQAETAERADLAEQARRLAEEDAQRAREEARLLAETAEKMVFPIRHSVGGQSRVGIPRSAGVTLEHLARLVVKLVRNEATVGLELRSDEALRTVWFENGRVVGASTNLPRESLLEQARRDGLIDKRQESELRMLRAASPAELVRALRTRGYIREIEVVPLVQRYTEHVTLEALSEDESIYRIVEEPPGIDVQLAAPTRPVLELLAEAVRRRVDAEKMLGALGGLHVIPSTGKSLVDPSELGFSGREQRLLAEVDGTRSIGELLLGSGLKQEAALKCIAVATLLDLAHVLPAEPAEAAPPPEIDSVRLEAKLQEALDADYFSMLGVQRSAGADEVQRAFEALAREFSPLKFTGHPDPNLHQQAEQLQALLGEAVRALRDDRLRREYARCLVD